MALNLLQELAELTDFAVVDAHHHLWDLEQGHYPWLQESYRSDTFMGNYQRLCSSYGPAQYLSEMQGLRIVGTVHVEAERARDESLQETIWLASIAQRNEGLATAVVPWIDLWAEDVVERIDAHLTANERVRAVRAKPRISSQPLSVEVAGGLSDPRLSRGFDALLKRDLGWDLRVTWFQLAEAAERLADFPGLRVVLNHAGLPWDRSDAGMRQWRHSMARLAELPRVCVKLSEFSAPEAPWDCKQVRRIIETVIDLFGARRCMFGSNQPVAGLAVSVPILVRTIVAAVGPRDHRALRAIFRETACVAYRIDLTEVLERSRHLALRIS